MSIKEEKIPKLDCSEKVLLTHLETLQNRISRHGARMWQLPLTYLAAIAGTSTLMDNNINQLSFAVIFLFLAILGLIIFWCFWGTKEGYERTGEALNVVEENLGLGKCTRTPREHIYPYALLIIFGITVSILLAWNSEYLVEGGSSLQDKVDEPST